MYTDGGQGASPNCVAMVMDSLRAALHSLPTNSYHLQTTDSREIITGHWMETCRLLVMPGGRDLPYVKELAGRGNANISEFVSNGGGYLGLCAGGYYGCARVEFAVGDPKLEVVGPRELRFFSGVCRGPQYPGYQYESNAGARAVPLSLEGTLADGAAGPISVFYDGGGTFLPFAPDGGEYEVLGRYAEGEPQPAIVKCCYGDGTAVLSGVHFEASAKMLQRCYPDDQYIARLLPEIEKYDKQRQVLFNSIVKLFLK